FDGAHDVETVTRVLSDEPRLIEDLAPELPAEIFALVHRLLENHPRDRFPDAETVIRALEAIGVNPKARLWLAREIERGVGGSATREHLVAPVGAAHPSPPPPPPSDAATAASLRAPVHVETTAA